MNMHTSPADKKMLALSVIRIDGGTQSRAQIYYNIVDDYADLMAGGAEFPPAIVFFDGESYWMADGFHRHAAHNQLGLAEMSVEIRQGSRREAILHSVGANASHGLRRTNDDKRRAVETLFNDDEWAQWSDREIARRCAVTHPFVSKCRPSGNDYQTERKFERGGKTHTQNIGNIGARKPTGDPITDGLNAATDTAAQESAMLGSDGSPRPVIDLKGRDPREYNRAMHFVGDFEHYARELAQKDVIPDCAILDPAERQRLRSAIDKIDAIHDQIMTRI